jgi:hypothetical protein
MLAAGAATTAAVQGRTNQANLLSNRHRAHDSDRVQYRTFVAVYLAD